MKNTFFTSQGYFQNGVAIVRIITGVMMVKHGFQVFETEDMNGYGDWLSKLHFPVPHFMAYVGKITELAGGFFLILGFLTRLAALMLILNMGVITFIMGDGKIFTNTDTQYPFLFLLIFLIFFITGAGKWSLDYLLFDRRKTIIYR